MKQKHRWIVGFLAAAVSFSLVGCTAEQIETAEPTSTSANGRYVEEEIILPMTISSASMSEFSFCNGVPAFVDRNNQYLYQQNESKTSFSASSIPSVDFSCSIDATAISPDGTYYSLCTIYDDSFDENTAEKLCAAAKAGKAVKGFSMDNSIWFSEAEYAPNDKIYAVGMKYTNSDNTPYQIYEVDVENETVTVAANSDIEKNSPLSLDIVGDYLVSINDDDIWFYNYVSHQMEKTPEAIRDFIQEQHLGESLNVGKPYFDICSGEDGTMYLACEAGLYRYVLNGNQVEQLIDGVTCHIGNPSWKIGSIIQENADSFLIAYQNGKIMRYHYDKDAGNSYDSKLKIYSLSKNETAMYAIEEYNSLYPNVQVTYEVASQEEENIDYDAAVEQLHLELLGDDPPDVILTDNMDIEMMIQENMILKLSDYEKDIIPETELLENVVKQEQNGSWYTMPCRFSLPCLIGDQSELDNISALSDLVDLTKKDCSEIEDLCIYFEYTENELFDVLMPFAWNSIVTEDGFQVDATAQFFIDCQKIYDLLLNRPFTYTRNVKNLCDNYLEKHCSYAAFNVSNISSLMSLNTLHIVNSSAGYRMDMETKNSYIPSCSLSICAKSKNIENAVRFLKTAVSDNVQNIESEDGFPVSIAVIEQYPNRKQHSIGSYYDEDYFYSSSTNKLTRVHNLTQEETEAFLNMLHALDTPVMDRGDVKAQILTYGKKYFSGEMTAETAAKEAAKSIIK